MYYIDMYLKLHKHKLFPHSLLMQNYACILCHLIYFKRSQKKTIFVHSNNLFVNTRKYTYYFNNQHRTVVELIDVRLTFLSKTICDPTSRRLCFNHSTSPIAAAINSSSAIFFSLVTFARLLRSGSAPARPDPDPPCDPPVILPAVSVFEDV